MSNDPLSEKELMEMPEKGIPDRGCATSQSWMVLYEAAETFRTKHREYGANDVIFGKVMDALFPEGLTLKGFDDWMRIQFFMLDIVKTTRYATNFAKGGHQDSVHDKIVYAAMLETFDASLKEKRDD